MSCHRWLVLPLIGFALSVGCNDRSGSTTAGGSSSATPPPATQPDPATGPTTAPATQPAMSHLTIDGKQYAFPGARLRVNRANGHVFARLYTADPKAALSDDYRGNGYDLVMRLDDITEPTEVYSSVWQYKAPSREYQDNLHGVFLDGIKYQLQPADVTARFLGDMLLVRVDVEGQFLQFDQSDTSAPPRLVYVKGSLLAPVEYKD
ncbi:MAG TPA: hypothetical protein VN541_07880 [Tepidisphaeraceae bacterium]|nr:hypothetical protein [Tepidisphaeraceae bacterium]